MKKTNWKIDKNNNSYRGTLYIIREWIFKDNKPNLIEKKLINVSDIPLYIR